MNSIVESFSELGTTTLEQVSEMQTRVLEWNRQMAETIVPRMPAMPGADAFGGPNLAADWVQASFALTSKALEANRAFTAGLIEAWTPKSDDAPTAPEAAAKMAKAAAKD